MIYKIVYIGKARILTFETESYDSFSDFFDSLINEEIIDISTE